MSRGRGTRGGGKPRRGPHGPNVLVTGDGGQYHTQGGAGPQAEHEGADLAAREFGVPEADIPGGVKHLVNPETHPDRPPGVHLRPADEHKYHGVEPIDYGGYQVPPDESEHYPVQKPLPVPDAPDAVPVIIVQDPQNKGEHRSIQAYNVNVHDTAQEPSRVCNYDPERVEIGLLNEDSNTDIRIGQLRDLQAVGAQGTGAAGEGALIWHGTNSYTWIKGQSELWASTTSASSNARLSVIVITESPETY